VSLPSIRFSNSPLASCLTRDTHLFELPLAVDETTRAMVRWLSSSTSVSSPLTSGNEFSSNFYNFILANLLGIEFSTMLQPAVNPVIGMGYY